jgi:hypothetical protein
VRALIALFILFLGYASLANAEPDGSVPFIAQSRAIVLDPPLDLKIQFHFGSATITPLFDYAPHDTFLTEVDRVRSGAEISAPFIGSWRWAVRASTTFNLSQRGDILSAKHTSAIEHYFDPYDSLQLGEGPSNSASIRFMRHF